MRTKLYLFDKISGTTYNADQIIGLSLSMAKNKSSNIRSYPSTTATIVSVVYGGDFVGIVYSYKVMNDGLWWMIQRDTKYFWIKHAEGYFDVESLHNQGALTPEEIAARKAEAEKSLTDKIFDKASSMLNTGLWIFGGYLGLKLIIGGFKS